MQSIRTSNIIDLAQLRRSRATARRDSLAWQTNLVRQLKEESWPSEERPTFRPTVLTFTPGERRRARRERRAWRLEVCASLAVILMAAVFVLRVLI